MKSNVGAQGTKIQVNKCCAQTFKSSIIWINISLDQQIDSKAIFPEQLKKGFRIRLTCLSRFLMHINLVCFKRRCFLEDLFIIIQNTYLILFLSHFPQPPIFANDNSLYHLTCSKLYKSLHWEELWMYLYIYVAKVFCFII